MIHKHHGGKAGVRLGMRRSLFRALILEGRIETTLARAKDLQSYTEGIVNIAKANSDVAKRRVFAEIGQDKKVFEKVFNSLVATIGTRTGGYTRILKAGQRMGDGSVMANIEWVDKEKVQEVQKVSKKDKNKLT
ncbi:MAG: 50S ribosomal protein L17 [bacterium]|nr:50S ribosomal protein L17 [bacterium]